MFINHVAALIAMTEPGYIFVTRNETCVAVVVGSGMYGLQKWENELNAFVGRVEMATPFNLSKPLNSFNPKI